MSTIMASPPSSAAVSLIVGMGVSTWVAVLAIVGYFARRFLDQQTRNHADTLTALNLLQHLDGRMPKNAKRRMRALEDVSHRHAKRVRTGSQPPQ